jgi:hypothetical protein
VQWLEPSRPPCQSRCRAWCHVVRGVAGSRARSPALALRLAKKVAAPCARPTHRAPRSCGPVLREGDLWGDLNTVGREAGSPLRLLETRPPFPNPFPLFRPATQVPGVRRHPGRRFVCALPRRTLAPMLVAAALEQSGWVRSTEVDVVTDGARGMRGLVSSVAPCIAAKILDWFHLAMKLHTVKTPLSARTDFWVKRPALMVRCARLSGKVRDALWRGRGEAAIEMVRTLTASLREAIPALPGFFAACAQTAHGAASASLVFLVNNRHDLVDYQQARMSGRRVSSASAESVMNHVVNRRLSKHQQMRWSMRGAHCLLQHGWSSWMVGLRRTSRRASRISEPRNWRLREDGAPPTFYPLPRFAHTTSRLC